MYNLKITINDLPKTTNANNKHWAMKMKEAQKWKQLVKLSVGSQKPSYPLEKAKLTCTRHSSKEPDYDGLVSSFKHLIDGLIESKVIIDDAMRYIGMPEFSWKQAPRSKGFIELEVQEIKA